MMTAKTKKLRSRLLHIKKWAAENAPNFLEKLADRVRVSIKDRVQSKGMGTKKKLKKYSASYKKFRKEKKRQTSFRDLTFSGKMLNAIDVLKQKTQVKIFFKGKEQQNKAEGNQKRTPFFGLGNSEDKIIKKGMKELIKAAL